MKADVPELQATLSLPADAGRKAGRREDSEAVYLPSECEETSLEAGLESPCAQVFVGCLAFLPSSGRNIFIQQYIVYVHRLRKSLCCKPSFFPGKLE